MLRDSQKMLAVMTLLNAIIMFVGAALIEKVKSSSNRLRRSSPRKSH
jgi:hypothetical protein